MSQSACCATTAIFGWRQNARRLNRLSRNRRMAPQTRWRILDRLTAPRVWGTHIDHRVIEMDAERSRSPKWIAQNQSQLCRVLMWGTHKNPHNRLFLKSIKERYGIVSLRKYLAPEVGLEPTTLRLTAECSAIELLRSVLERG